MFDSNSNKTKKTHTLNNTKKNFKKKKKINVGH